MTVALGATWHPRGELPRLERLLPQMVQVYSGILIVIASEADADIHRALRELCECWPGLSIAVVQDWSWGRFTALQKALDFDAAHIQYADLDRLLRWIETRPQEWRRTVELIQDHDCLVIGRTEAAYRTHPQSLVRTEAISNLVASHLLGRQVDVSAGSKGFSRAAAEFLVASARPGDALGTDAKWPILLKRAGFEVGYITVDGLDWEIPDQYQDAAAGPQRQAQIAREYDADPANWARRVEVALEIVRSGLEAAGCDIRRITDH